jgi:hypothetical protein
VSITTYDLPAQLRIRPVPCQGRGGAGLVGRQYTLGGRLVTVLVAYGAGASVRNVWLRFADDGTETIRPFRGLRRLPEQAGAR